MAADPDADPRKDPDAHAPRRRTRAEGEAILAAEVEQIRNDPAFVARVREVIARDQELLDRLAE